jgi:cyclic-di-GMP-binding protein
LPASGASFTIGLVLSATCGGILSYLTLARNLSMPSFDIISEVDSQEISNAVANTQRELANRWDFRQVVTSVELNEIEVTVKIATESDFQLQQLLDILYDQLSKRGIERNACTIPSQPTHRGRLWSFEIPFKQGIDALLAKKIVKLIKTEHPKAQAQIQDKQVRVTDKSRNTLQLIMALLRQAVLEQPLQFTNFRD